MMCVLVRCVLMCCGSVLMFWRRLNVDCGLSVGLMLCSCLEWSLVRKLYLLKLFYYLMLLYDLIGLVICGNLLLFQLNVFFLIMILFRVVLWLLRNFVIEWMMMLVLCLSGCVRQGVVRVVFMMSGILVVWVMVVSFLMLVILLEGLLIILMQMIFVFGWIVFVKFVGFVEVMKVVFILKWCSVMFSCVIVLLQSCVVVMM